MEVGIIILNIVRLLITRAGSQPPVADSQNGGGQLTALAIRHIIIAFDIFATSPEIALTSNVGLSSGTLPTASLVLSSASPSGATSDLELGSPMHRPHTQLSPPGCSDEHSTLCLVPLPACAN